MSDTSASNQPDTFDLSLALDRDVLRQRLEAAYPEERRQASALLSEFERFRAKNGDGIGDEVMQARAGAFCKRLLETAKSIEAARVKAKKPIDEASAVVQGFFAREMIDPLTASAAGVQLLIKRFADAQVLAKQNALTEEAERQRAQAALLATEATDTGNREKMHRAVAMDQQAEEIAAQAASPEILRSAAVTSDIGVRTGLRLTPWKVRVIDLEKVPRDYLQLNVAKALVDLMGRKELTKLAALNAGQQPIAGIEFYRDTAASIR